MIYPVGSAILLSSNWHLNYKYPPKQPFLSSHRGRVGRCVTTQGTAAKEPNSQVVQENVLTHIIYEFVTGVSILKVR